MGFGLLRLLWLASLALLATERLAIPPPHPLKPTDQTKQEKRSHVQRHKETGDPCERYMELHLEFHVERHLELHFELHLELHI